MKFTQLALLAASALGVAAAPDGTTCTSTLASIKALHDPEAWSAFQNIVNNTPEAIAGFTPKTKPDVEKRCCSGICCDYDSCVEDVTFCLWQCANIPGAGQLGCIAGCYVACG